MTDRPIIFSAPMVTALLAGRKTQTRRILKPPYGTLEYLGNGTWKPIHTKVFRGDRLYVREAHYLTDDGDEECVVYAEDHASVAEHLAAIQSMQADLNLSDAWAAPHKRLRPSIHMPRWASRITLTVTDVRVQRLQGISAADTIAEGIWCSTCEAMNASACNGRGCFASIDAFRGLWNSLHGPDAWNANPWVAAYSFSVQRENIDEVPNA